MHSPWNKLVSPSPNLLGLHTDVKYAILLCLRCHQKSTWALLVLEHHFLPFIPARTFAFPLNKNQELTFDIKGVIGSFSAATSFCMRASRIIKFVALVSWVRRSGSSDCISSDCRKTKTQVIIKALSWKFCKLSDSERNVLLHNTSRTYQHLKINFSGSKNCPKNHLESLATPNGNFTVNHFFADVKGVHNKTIRHARAVEFYYTNVAIFVL